MSDTGDKRQTLEAERARLFEEKQANLDERAKLMQKISVASQAARASRDYNNPRQWDKEQRRIRELGRIDQRIASRLGAIRAELRVANVMPKHQEYRVFKQVVKDFLGEDMFMQFIAEMEHRMDGQKPNHKPHAFEYHSTGGGMSPVWRRNRLGGNRG